MEETEDPESQPDKKSHSDKHKMMAGKRKKEKISYFCRLLNDVGDFCPDSISIADSDKKKNIIGKYCFNRLTLKRKAFIMCA